MAASMTAILIFKPYYIPYYRFDFHEIFTKQFYNFKSVYNLVSVFLKKSVIQHKQWHNGSQIFADPEYLLQCFMREDTGQPPGLSAIPEKMGA